MPFSCNGRVTFGDKEFTFLDIDGAIRVVAMVRSAALTGFAALADSLGLDPKHLMTSAGLPLEALQAPHLRIPVHRVRQLLELSASRARVENFGLRLGETRQASNLGLLAPVLRETSTLRAGICAVARYVRLHNEALSIRLEKLDDAWFVQLRFTDSQADTMRQSVELSVTVMHRALGELFDDDWSPELVCLAYPAPEDLTRHQRIFSSRMQFDAVATGFVCAEETLDRLRKPMTTLLSHDARAHLEQLLASTEPTTGAKVRETIAWLLPTGICSADAVAEQLGLERRTLHRHLTREGGTYAELLDEVRRDLVQQQLAHGQRPVKEIASLLGFEAPSVLSRWFRTRFGCSTTEWRRQTSRSIPS